MKIHEDPNPGRPLSITIESREEMETFRELVNVGGAASTNRSAKGLSIVLEDYFTKNYGPVQ